MRLQTITGIAALALSSAALAQVASSPAERKLTPHNAAIPGNDMLMTDNSLAGPASTDPATTNTVVDDAMANSTLPDNTMANAASPN